MAEELRVLLIDDDVENRAIMARLIRAIGHIPAEASFHEKAMELLSKLTFDYFIPKLTIPYSNNDPAEFDNSITLIDKIRDFYPKSVEYPIIVFGNCQIDHDDLGELMEVGANCFLPFGPGVPEDKTKLRRIIIRLTEKALAKRKTSKTHESHSDIDTSPILEKLATRYKLVVDLITMEVYFKGIRLPSGNEGLQQRHKSFLFILARNPGKAMSFDEVRAELRELKIDEFTDPAKNIRNQIRKTLRVTAKNHPGQITDNDIKTFIKTIPTDLTRLALTAEEIFTIHGNEKYPSL